jgi:hypothetical protein
MTVDTYHAEEFPLPLKNKGIYRENLLSAHQNTFIVCALFTSDKTQYYKYACRLAASCEKFGLPYSICQIPDIHRSINLNGSDDLAFTKANFIAYNMARFPDKNILYVDVDFLFVNHPMMIADISETGCNFAIYNWLSDEHNEAYVPLMKEFEGKTVFSEFYKYSHHIGYYCNMQLICSGGVQFYRNCLESQNLLKAWQSVIAQNPYSADDECMDYTYNNLDSNFIKLHPAWLDKSYLRLPWWPHVKPVILHPGLPIAGGNRIHLTERDNKKRFYPEKCQKKTALLYFPPDCIIDTKRYLLLKIKNSDIVDRQKIKQDFWIYHENTE